MGWEGRRVNVSKSFVHGAGETQLLRGWICQVLRLENTVRGVFNRGHEFTHTGFEYALQWVSMRRDERDYRRTLRGQSKISAPTAGSSKKMKTEQQIKSCAENCEKKTFFLKKGNKQRFGNRDKSDMAHWLHFQIIHQILLKKSEYNGNHESAMRFDQGGGFCSARPSPMSR